MLKYTLIASKRLTIKDILSMLRIGTCSWKYDSWRGILYSDDPKINYLKEYAAKYDTVEIDQWFWSLHGPKKITLPNPNVVSAYKLSIPSDFKFTIKVPNSITLTHFYRKSKKDPLEKNSHFLSYELFDQFLYLIEPIKENVGRLMFQFEYLNKQKMTSQKEFQKQFEKFIGNCSNDFEYSIEIRNPNYLNNEYFDFLESNGLGHVFLQGYYMPPIYEVFDKINNTILNPVIRLHGPDRKLIETKSGGKWNKIIEPKDSELKSIIKMIELLLNSGNDIYLNVNNHYEGSAPLTIEKINKLLKSGK